MNRFQNYVIPNFKNVRLKDLSALKIQKVLNQILEQGHKRTAEAVYYTLKTVLDYAVNIDLIAKNPLVAVKIPLHERNTGKALPMEIEKSLFQRLQDRITSLILLLCNIPDADLANFQV